LRVNPETLYEFKADLVIIAAGASQRKKNNTHPLIKPSIAKG